jgi:uncharacterized protein
MSQPRGYASVEDKTWALVAHFGGALGTFISGGVLGFVAPLVALLARGNQVPTVREHARNALNFFIPVSVVALVLSLSWPGGFWPFGFGLLASGFVRLLSAAVWVVGIVFGIVAGIRANDGQLYRYPLALPIIK